MFIAKTKGHFVWHSGKRKFHQQCPSIWPVRSSRFYSHRQTKTRHRWPLGLIHYWFMRHDNGPRPLPFACLTVPVQELSTCPSVRVDSGAGGRWKDLYGNGPTIPTEEDLATQSGCVTRVNAVEMSGWTQVEAMPRSPGQLKRFRNSRRQGGIHFKISEIHVHVVVFQTTISAQSLTILSFPGKIESAFCWATIRRLT